MKKRFYVIIGISVFLVLILIINVRNLYMNKVNGNVPIYYLVGTIKQIETDYIYVDVEKIKSEGTERTVSLNMCISTQNATMANIEKNEKVEISTFDDPQKEENISAYRITHIENTLQ